MGLSYPQREIETNQYTTGTLSSIAIQKIWLRSWWGLSILVRGRGFSTVFLSNVKARTYDPRELKKQLKYFHTENGTMPKNASLPDIAIVNKAFSEDVKKKLLSLKYKIKAIRNPEVRDFYMLGLLSILESVSNTSKTGGFLRITKKRVSGKDVYPKYLSRIEAMINDVEKFNDGLRFTRVETSAEI